MSEHHMEVRRSARVAMLGERGPHIREVWIVLHGFGQLARYFIRPFDAIARPDLLVVAPEALNRYYLETSPQQRGPDSKVGATWMTREDREREIADYVAYLDQVCDWVYAQVPRQSARLTVLGFSQGVATASRWLAMGQTRADRVVLWAGALADDLPAGTLGRSFAGVEVTLVAGRSDPFMTEERFSAAEKALRADGIELRVKRFDGAHTLDAAVLAQLVSSIHPLDGADR